MRCAHSVLEAMTRELYLGTLVRAEQVVQPADEMIGRFFVP